MEKTNTKFKIGDIVGLKSFGPKMTITHVDGDEADVAWFDKADAQHTATYPLAALKPLETTPLFRPIAFVEADGLAKAWERALKRANDNNEWPVEYPVGVNGNSIVWKAAKDRKELDDAMSAGSIIVDGAIEARRIEIHSNETKLKPIVRSIAGEIIGENGSVSRYRNQISSAPLALHVKTAFKHLGLNVTVSDGAMPENVEDYGTTWTKAKYHCVVSEGGFVTLYEFDKWRDARNGGWNSIHPNCQFERNSEGQVRIGRIMSVKNLNPKFGWKYLLDRAIAQLNF